MSESTSVVIYDPRQAGPEVVAVAGFLAGYSGRIREAYTLHLRQFFAWCGRRGVRLFDLHRAEIELFARELEELGRARATIGRRLSTVVGFYRYAEEEGLIEHSPAVHVRRPRLDYESHAVGLDRNELGAFLVAAGLASARDHALACLLALNGLRISEALGADIDALGLERGHRTLRVHRKGTRLSPSRWRPARPGRSIWPPASGWMAPSSSTPTERACAATGPPAPCAAWLATPGSPRGSAPTASGIPSSPPPSTRECRCATCRRPRRTPIPARLCAMTGPASHSTDTPPTLLPPSWLAPRAATSDSPTRTR